MINVLKKIIRIILTIFILLIIAKFFIYMLPFILIFTLGYLVYKRLNYNYDDNTIIKENNKININKKNKILEGEIIKEKIDN